MPIGIDEDIGSATALRSSQGAFSGACRLGCSGRSGSRTTNILRSLESRLLYLAVVVSWRLHVRKEARTLYGKAADSLVLAVDHFNSVWDRGRIEAVLIMLDRAFELLLKAIIVDRNGKIRAKDSNLTIGFDSCLRKCISEEPLRCLTEDEAVTLQNLNSLRDAAQHYFTELSEDLLYIYAQSAVTLFDKLSTDVLRLTLSDTMPKRVLPVSPKPPRDFGLILDGEFGDIAKMLSPGSRKGLDAKARIRSVAILQSSLDGQKSQPSDRELDGIVKRIRAGDGWRAIFPGVATLRIDPNATGPGLALRITKKEGEAIRLVPEGSPDAAVMAVKRVNELDFYSMGLNDLADKLKATSPKLLALIIADQMQKNLDYFKLVKIGRTAHKRYSPEALNHLHKRLKEVDLDAVWQQHRPRPAAKQPAR